MFSLYKKIYRKGKNIMYKSTEMWAEGGAKGLLGQAIFRTAWFLLFVVIIITYISTLGGRLVKEQESDNGTKA